MEVDMDASMILQILKALPPDVLGKMVSDINATDVPQNTLMNNKKDGMNGVRLQVPGMRTGIYSSPISAPRA